MLFSVIEGAQIILRAKGVYKQVPAYRRGDELFAKIGGGFIGLRADQNKSTTAPAMLWEEIDGVDWEVQGPFRKVFVK